MTDQIVAALSNAQVWTVVFSGLAALCGALAPIIVAKIEANKARAAAAADVKKAAEQAKVALKAAARKDAVEEWQALYGEREKQVARLHAQNAEQQKQLDVLKAQHQDCEDRHAVLERKVNALDGTVTKLANGNKP